ncbi:hypothetical protein Tco_0860737 [Tanacetum coccineum]|uniref:Uncharacterized protein n=1 Tax=Tanacetum coccineum TaxID=301880 RepID=A0ABQ5BFU2_9ASTR
MNGVRKDEYAIESEVFNLLKIDADLFTYETPLGMVINEFKRLSSMENDLFTYELGVVEQFEDYMEIKRQKKVYRLDADMEYDPSNVNFAEWSVSKFSKHMTMDWYTKNALWVYWIRGDDEEVLTEDELSDIQEGSLSEGDEIAEIFRIEINIFHFETPLCKAFKEFNYLRKIDVDVLTKDIPGFKTYEEYKDEWIYQWNKGIPWVSEKPWGKMENQPII